MVSLISPFKYALMKSSCYTCISSSTANAINIRIDPILATGANVSSKSTPGICVNPLATSLALRRSSELIARLYSTHTNSSVNRDVQIALLAMHN